ncbi:MAG: hypothetical protein ACXWIN_02565, partial [Burkholderiaceae bacterium]
MIDPQCYGMFYKISSQQGIRRKTASYGFAFLCKAAPLAWLILRHLIAINHLSIADLLAMIALAAL